jgi:hypothetical protein
MYPSPPASPPAVFRQIACHAQTTRTHLLFFLFRFLANLSQLALDPLSGSSSSTISTTRWKETGAHLRLDKLEPFLDIRFRIRLILLYQHRPNQLVHRIIWRQLSKFLILKIYTLYALSI